jgi:TatD DNase family protein
VSASPDGLPPLDTHAHLSPDVTDAQLRRLGNAQIVGMTLSLAEAEYVRPRADANVTWAIGTHPTAYRDLAAFDVRVFSSLIPQFAVVGEVGLDFRGGRRQQEVFTDILRVAADHEVLMSIHSTGMVSEVLEALAGRRESGTILHWFAGTPDEVASARGLGCYFSVNLAMTDEVLAGLPMDRVLTETDFPAASKTGAKKPGDTAGIEARLAKLWDFEPDHVRHQVYRNLRDLARSTALLDRIRPGLALHLLAA